MCLLQCEHVGVIVRTYASMIDCAFAIVTACVRLCVCVRMGVGG